MRLAPLAALAALAALAGCGGNKGLKAQEQSGVDTPGSSGRELSVNDAGPVADALREIQHACFRGNSPSTIGGAVKVITHETRVNPTGVYETGNSARAEQMKEVARDTAAQLRECRAPKAAAALEAVAEGPSFHVK